MKTVTKIDANPNTAGSEKRLRVAAYCRVSTDSDDQLESLEEQKKHYESYIQAQESWDHSETAALPTIFDYRILTRIHSQQDCSEPQEPARFPLMRC